MNRTHLVLFAALGLFSLIYAAMHFININRVNPLYARCKKEVKVGMSRDEVRQLCGKPVFAFSSGPYSDYSYYEKLNSNETLSIRFEEDFAIRVRLETD